MSISSRVAHPLLASIFVSSGLDTVRHPESKVKAAEKVTGPLARQFPALPDDTATLVRINGGVQVVAATLLSVGKLPRLAALILIGSLVPTTYAGHPFWDEVDDEQRARQQIQFLKNLGILGGLILAAADTGGAPSVGWRVRRQVRSAGSTLSRQKVDKGHRALKSMADAGGQTWHALDGMVLKEGAKGAELAGHYLSAGAEATSALLAHAKERLPAA